MADMAQTAADVQIKGVVTSNRVDAGEAGIQPGDSCYEDSEGNYFLASNDVDDATAAAKGMALTPAAAIGDPFELANAGPIDPGGVVAVSVEYVISENDGKLKPHSDLASTERYTRVGYGTADDTIELDYRATGVAAP